MNLVRHSYVPVFIPIFNKEVLYFCITLRLCFGTNAHNRKMGMQVPGIIISFYTFLNVDWLII